MVLYSTWLNFRFSLFSPGDHPDVIAVGSTTSEDGLSSFSSVGPSLNGTIKPDISAPGSSINSAFNAADDSYYILSGASMACPHVAGVVALMIAHSDPAKELTVNDIKYFLNAGADTETLILTCKNCGGVSENQFPNNAFGFGRVNALRSVESVVKERRA
jgi:subtilisin family serine protease